MMPNNQLPISKIFLAGFAFVLTHWKQIIQMSIVPVLISWPFFLILPELLILMEEVFSGGELVVKQLPDNMMIYLLLFTYAYASLSIGTYRLVMLGNSGVNGWMPILDFGKIARFMGLTLFIGFLTILPVMITGLPILQLVMAFLLMPLNLNFINIATGVKSKYKWQLSFPVHANLFFLQILLPALVVLLFAFLAEKTGLGMALTWAVKAILFYWTLVTLALCYQLINASSEEQNP